MDQIKAANKRRREKYKKTKAYDESLAAARIAIIAKEKANGRKEKSRAKRRNIEHEQL